MRVNLGNVLDEGLRIDRGKRASDELEGKGRRNLQYY
jgi:hypothetical protein